MSHKKKSTAQVIHEYGGLLTKYYLIAMFAVLPLFSRNGYSDIAESKYIFYRLITVSYIILCGFICFPIECICEKGECFKKKHPLPIVIALVHFLFGAVTWIFAEDHLVAFWGSGSWHNGFLVQSMFIIGALLVYYYFSDSKFVLVAFGIGLGISSLLIVLNRFDIYPINMGDKYAAFVSTLGQTNWATTCLGCLMGAGMALYVYEQNKATRIIWFILTAVALTGAWMIGSDTIIPVMLFEFFALLGICLKKRELMERFASLLVMWGIVTEIVYFLVFVFFYNKFVFVDEGDAVNSLLRKHIGVLILVIAVIVYCAVYLTRNRGWDAKVLVNSYRVLVFVLLLSVIVGIILMVIVTLTPEKAGKLANIRMLNFDDDWGTHRGLNWKCSVIAFTRMPFLRKIIGLGQGSFRACMMSFPDLQNRIELMYGKYALRVAHNEYLNMLIENGILGCASYIALLESFFITLWKRADKYCLALVGLIPLAGYLACSIFFFQHFYATPLMYIFVAMGLSQMRNPGNGAA